MSRDISRGSCNIRPGNDELSLALYPLYHAFTSPSNLADVMYEIAHDHSDFSRFDGQLMRNLAEDIYMQSSDAQSAEGRIRKDNSLLKGELKRLNTMYKWPLVRQMAADWAPMVRYDFLWEEGKRLGSKPLYGAGKEHGMDDELLRSRLGYVTNQQRCHTSEINLASWPIQSGSALATATPLPLRPEPPMGVRGKAPGLVNARTQRLLPGQVATELCTQRY